MIDSNLGDMGFILSEWVYRTNNLKSRLLCSSPNQSTPIRVVLHHYYLNETLMAKLLTPQNKLLIIINISSVSSITTLLCLLLLIKTHKILQIVWWQIGLQIFVTLDLSLAPITVLKILTFLRNNSRSITLLCFSCYSVKSFRIRSLFGPFFLAFRLNMDIYFVSLCI